MKKLCTNPGSRKVLLNIRETIFFRRVHVTKATLHQLGDRFEVEPGDGGSRDSYLDDHKVETFLIIPPKVRLIYC